MAFAVYRVLRQRRRPRFDIVDEDTQPPPHGSTLVRQGLTRSAAEAISRNLLAQRDRSFRVAEGSADQDPDPEDRW